MKTLKISSFIILTVLLNCTVEDIGKTFETVVVNTWQWQEGNEFYFTPPEWIKGVWYMDDNNKLEFENKDVIFWAYDSYSWTPISMNRQLNEMTYGTYKSKLIEEIATDSSYSFTIGVYGDSSTNYLFQKISLDSMLHTRSSYNRIWKYGRRD